MIRGSLTDYDWGVIDGLVAWTGFSTGGPQAELWYGVHPGGPSPVIGPAGEVTGELLSSWVAADDVPLLVKFLAAARPLSVQVHPQAAQAAAGFDAQVGSSDSRAVYADRAEKTEMLIALEPFEVFAGWRDLEQAVAFLRALQSAAADFDPSAAIAAIIDADFKSALTPLLAASSPAAIAALGPAAEFIGLPEHEIAAYRLVATDYPQDPGALLTPLMAFLTLQVGEALYVPAGIPHSYIRGIGIEVMTSSDNVIRFGLTSKPVFLDHALRALDEQLKPEVISAAVGMALEPDSAPFVARLIREGSLTVPSGEYRVVLAVEGSAKVISLGSEVTLLPGTANVLAAHDPEILVQASGLTAVIQACDRGAQ